MSASTTDQSKYFHNSVDEDELSTSIGSSDNEATSGEESPVRCQVAATALPKSPDTAKEIPTLVQYPADLVAEFCAIILTFFFSMGLIPPQPMQALAPRSQDVKIRERQQHRTQRPGNGHPFQRKKLGVPPPLPPPPGLRRDFQHGRSATEPKATLPPGLEAEGMELEGFRLDASVLRFANIGAPPGLDPPDVHTTDVQSTPLVPPGLEVFTPPPGVFHCQAKPSTATPLPAKSQSRSKRQRNRKVVAVVEPEVLPRESAMPPKPNPPVLIPREFEQAVYRKELSDVLRDLANGSNVAVSVRRIRAQNVPLERQAPEFRDILTRAAEESRGVARRVSFAFAAGLAAGDPSAFHREACLYGIELFFDEIFEDLASEVPRLRNKIANELIPTLRTVFSEEDLERLVPDDCRSVIC